MKAVLVEEFGPYREVRMHEVPVPEVAAREVLVEAHTMGINFPDVLMIAGRYQARPPLPFIPGMEVAGEVIAVG